jgi:hypothetical protein
MVQARACCAATKSLRFPLERHIAKQSSPPKKIPINRGPGGYAGVSAAFFDQASSGTGIYSVAVASLLTSRIVELPMRIALAKPLFACDALEDSPSLQTPRSSLPPSPMNGSWSRSATSAAKGATIIPYPSSGARCCWAIVLRHQTVNACSERFSIGSLMETIVERIANEEGDGNGSEGACHATLFDGPSGTSRGGG